MENKLLHGVDRKYGRCVPEGIIQQEVDRNKKQDKLKGEGKLVVMKGDVTCPDVLVCSIYVIKPLHINSTVSDIFKWTLIKKKFCIKIENNTVDMTFHRLNVIHM